ncbi:MAG: hypothetical protein H0U27_02220 [Nitrosopumilus sp.]|nr:hypothetical protein [Nitrosopumilus sp.]
MIATIKRFINQCCCVLLACVFCVSINAGQSEQGVSFERKQQILREKAESIRKEGADAVKSAQEKAEEIRKQGNTDRNQI